MKNSVFPLASVFLLGLIVFPIGVKAQMGPGRAEQGSREWNRAYPVMIGFLSL